MLYHKARLSKFKKIEITSSKFSDPNATRLEINHKEKKKNIKHTHTHTQKVEAKQYSYRQPKDPEEI